MGDVPVNGDSHLFSAAFILCLKERRKKWHLAKIRGKKRRLGGSERIMCVCVCVSVCLCVFLCVSVCAGNVSFILKFIFQCKLDSVMTQLCVQAGLSLALLIMAYIIIVIMCTSRRYSIVSLKTILKQHAERERGDREGTDRHREDDKHTHSHQRTHTHAR